MLFQHYLSFKFWNMQYWWAVFSGVDVNRLLFWWSGACPCVWIILAPVGLHDMCKVLSLITGRLPAASRICRATHVVAWSSRLYACRVRLGMRATHVVVTSSFWCTLNNVITKQFKRETNTRECLGAESSWGWGSMNDHWPLSAPRLVLVFLLLFLSSHFYLKRACASFFDPSAAFEQLWSVVGHESRFL